VAATGAAVAAESLCPRTLFISPESFTTNYGP
jgi:hypothetical protein